MSFIPFTEKNEEGKNCNLLRSGSGSVFPEADPRIRNTGFDSNLMGRDP